MRSIPSGTVVALGTQLARVTIDTGQLCQRQALGGGVT